MVTAARRKQLARAGSARTPAKRRSQRLDGLNRFELRKLSALLKSDPRALSHPVLLSALSDLHRAIGHVLDAVPGSEVAR